MLRDGSWNEAFGMDGAIVCFPTEYCEVENWKAEALAAGCRVPIIPVGGSLDNSCHFSRLAG